MYHVLTIENHNKQMSWRVCFENLVYRHFPLRDGYKTLKTNFIYTTKMPYYAVAKGRSTGIFQTWDQCEAQVKGFSGARYKKFNSPTEAENFIATEGGSAVAQKSNVGSSKSSSNNLKRPYSSAPSSHLQTQPYSTKSKKPSKSEKNSSINSSDFDSDDSDDLSTIIAKQLDDIESRVVDFQKGLNKIVGKNSKSNPRKAILIEPEPKKKKTSKKSEFEEDEHGYVQVYTDGACSSNGKNGARAGLGVFWGEDHPLNVSRPVSGRATNNCGEIQAATCAIQQAIDNGITKLTINTDSKFLINSVTKWMQGWKRKGWKLKSGEPVKNEVDFKELDKLQNMVNIKWQYVEAHQGHFGNERADSLAKAGAAMYNI